MTKSNKIMTWRFVVKPGQCNRRYAIHSVASNSQSPEVMDYHLKSNFVVREIVTYEP